MKTKLPKEILAYVCDFDEDGKPIYSIAENVSEIPEDSNGDKVGVYVLTNTCTFKVKRELQ